jgi:hypothetical protein
MNKRQRIELTDLRPTLGGRIITSSEVLEIRSSGRWRQVTLGKSKDGYRHWVLRFQDNPTTSVLAIGTFARRVEPLAPTP